MARRLVSLQHQRRIQKKNMCTVLLILIVILQQHELSSTEAHSGCWDNSNNIVIPFWNIAARHQKQQQQRRHQQQQRTLLLQQLTTNSTNHDAAVDYCVASSSHGQQQQQHGQQRHTHRRPIAAHQNYRGGAATSTPTETKALELTTSIATDVNATRLDMGFKPLIFDKNYPYQFSFFQNGDGSDEDVDGIPTRFLIMQNYDRELAKTAVQNTLQWRKEHDIDTILQRPQIYFDIAKQVFPHYFVDVRDSTDHIIFVQRPALLNLKLADHNNLTPTKLLEHYIYVNEYLWQILEGKNALATMTSIIDLHGLNFKYLRQGDIVNFMKEFVKTMDHHYPQRANKTLIINAPKWFNILYKIVSPLLRESTKAKIEIFTRGKRQDKVLKALLGNSNNAEKLLPASFFMRKKDNKRKKDDRKQMMKKNRRGMRTEVEEEVVEELPEGEEKDGTTTTIGDDIENDDDYDGTVDDGAPILPSKFETELREFTLARIKEGGVQMLDVAPLP